MTGAEYVVHCLRAEGVTQLFGYPGGAVIPLYDALYSAKDIHHIRTCHEQGAAHAADGYARVTGNVGVCIATSGPGATNVITGMATAHLDSVPLVVITGQVGVNALGKDAFQEVDITGMTMSVTKYNVLVRDVKDLPKAMSKAFYMAREGRPGVVLVDITKNVMMSDMETEEYVSKPVLPVSSAAVGAEQMTEIVSLLSRAKRPVIYAGGGVVRGGHSAALTRFMEATGIPVCSSLMGLGNVDRRNPLSYGMVGMHGDSAANMLCHEADVVLGVGVRFSDRAIGNRYGFSKDAKIIHLDVDDREFEKNLDSYINVIGNYTEILNHLTESVTPQTTDWRRNDKIQTRLMHPQRIFAAVAKAMPEDTVVVTDVGQHQMWAAKFWPVNRPNAFISSGGLGTMGFGVGAAMGVKRGALEHPVLLVTGDGSFRMNHNEVLTLSAHNIPITILLFNNHALGMVRQWQGMFNEERYSETDIFDPLNLEFLSKAYNISYAKVETEDDLTAAMAKRTETGILLIECMMDRDERVYPIVPAGKSVNEYVDELILE